MLPPLHAETDCYLVAGRPVVRVAFAGVAGVGSEGNHHGAQMRDVVMQAVQRHQPGGVIIDLLGLDYQFGDWIGSCCFHPHLRSLRVCLVAAGRTWEALRPLWRTTGLESLVPVFQTIADAEAYVRAAGTGPGDEPDARHPPAAAAAAAAGVGAMRQQNRPDDPAPLSYATPEPPRPAWVVLGLWGLPNRASAWVCFWIAMAIAAFSAVRGFADPRWFLGVGMVLAALWYWAAIRWVDEHGGWR